MIPGIARERPVSVCRLALSGDHLAKLMPPGTNERLPNVITLTNAVLFITALRAESHS